MSTMTLSQRVSARENQFRSWRHMMRPKMAVRTDALLSVIDLGRPLLMVGVIVLAIGVNPPLLGAVAFSIAMWFLLGHLRLLLKDHVLERAFATLDPAKTFDASPSIIAPTPSGWLSGSMSMSFKEASKKPKSSSFSSYEGPPKKLRKFDDDAIDFDDADEYAAAPSYAAGGSYKSKPPSKSTSAPAHASAYADKDAVDFDDAA